MDFEKISVIGLGYIGLPTAALFASKKINVIGVDVNQDTVNTINQGKIHIVEPDLDLVVHAAVSEGYLRATITPEPSDAFLIAVPTPLQDDNHQPDLNFIKAASKSISKVLKKGDLVILESTSPVGTTEKMAGWLAEQRPDLSFPETSDEDSDIRIAYCPERVLPGQVLTELVANDRVIGGLTPKCSAYAVALYDLVVFGECVITNARTAEMAKLTENAFRDVNIAFANELSMICGSLDINVWELIRLANRHPRVNILQPGAGVGGHCIAVDPWFIVSKNPNEAKIIRSARDVNDNKPLWVIEQLNRAVSIFQNTRDLNNPARTNVACYGLTFKPNIDDLRGSPALAIVNKLVTLDHLRLMSVEPNVDRSKISNEIELVSLEYASKNADIHLILVAHDEFKKLKIDSGYVIDTTGLFEHQK